jgi:hypothetical protein
VRLLIALRLFAALGAADALRRGFTLDFRAMQLRLD